VLEVADLTVRHGGLVALDSVTLEVAEGEITGLIGPNGAGKTTFIDTVAGFTTPERGRVALGGEPVIDLAPHDRARRGLARTFQSLELFDDLTVRENLLVAASTPTWRSTLTDALWPKRRVEGRAEEVLATLALSSWTERLPTSLSNGRRHLVALARALVARPRLVLLDEPAAGLDAGESDELRAVIERLPGLGTSVLLVDHDMALVLGVCHRVHVLDVGRVIAGGTPAAVRADPAVVTAYLGVEADNRAVRGDRP
jgi:branched-chain amino acid transport system ATP-binding protein